MIDDTLALLDEMNEAGRIEYDDYRALHDAVSVITLPIPDADVAERIARALEEAAEKHPNPIVRLNLSDAADIARSHATPPVSVEVEWEWHLRDESGDLWTGPFASEEQAQATRRETRPHWIVVRRRRAGPWIEVSPVATTGEGDDRG